MRSIFLGVLLLIAQFFSPAPVHQAKIKPGISVGPCKLGDTHFQVRSELGHGLAEEHVFIAPRCGQRHPFVLLTYADDGLVLEFPGEKLKGSSTVTSICVVAPSDARTDSGIDLTSSRAEVLAAFGQADTSYGREVLYYGRQGIEFGFSELVADSMLRIHVFAPRPEARY